MRKETKVRQHDKNDCAAACIASVCAHYGLMLPAIRIREACGTGPDGTTMQGIIDAFGKLGMDAAGLKAKQKNISELKNASMPLIMHLQKKNGWLHFTVLYGIGGTHATIMDPADGKMHKVALGELEEEWSGYIVAAAPSPSFRKGDSRTDVRSRIKKLVISHRKEFLLIMAGSIACIAATLSISLFAQEIIDRAIPSGSAESLAAISSAMLLLALTGWFVSHIRTVLLVRTSLKIDSTLISGYFRKLFSLPASFFDSTGSGDLNSRISDAYRIRSFITERLMLMSISIITIVATAAVMTALCWKLALITMSSIPVFIIIYTVSDRKGRAINRKVIERNAKFEQSCIEWISAARTVRYCDAGKAAADKAMAGYFPMASALYRSGFLTSAVTSASETAGRLTCTATLVAGAFFVLRSEISIGELVTFFSLATMFCSPVILLIESNREITEAGISAERLFDIMDLDPEDSGGKGKSIPGNVNEIEFRNVCFSYTGRKKLLENISFSIRPGKINLICGPNGCGKSTVAALLMRGYVPQAGTITAGGTDIQTIPLAAWRKFVTLVPQKTDIFDGSILENIVMGNEEYDARDVAAACAMAGLYADTGENACRLSGGEKQKLALARALYRKPGVIILDEASSHMDVESRKRFMEILDTLKGNSITVILISHDNDMDSVADNIIEIKTDAHS